jgi:uncharacterized membrane protein
MNETATEETNNATLQTLKRVTATVYLCQVLTFMLAGLPLLVGVALNFYKKNDAKGTWLESHFDWQIKTAWVALAGFALAGITFVMDFGLLFLAMTLVWMIYRIAVGWYALTDGKSIDNRMN